MVQWNCAHNVDDVVHASRGPSEVFSATLDSVNHSPRGVPGVLDRRVHLEDRVCCEQWCVGLHLDPDLRLRGPGRHIKGVPCHVVGPLGRRNHCIARARFLPVVGTLLLNEAVHVALRKVVGPALAQGLAGKQDQRKEFKFRCHFKN